MDEAKWTVKGYAGPKGERMWAVVHRERPMFLAIISDRSVEALQEVPLAAVYWAKPEIPIDADSYRRRAIEVLKERRGAPAPSHHTRRRRRADARDKTNRATEPRPPRAGTN